MDIICINICDSVCVSIFTNYYSDYFDITVITGAYMVKRYVCN